MSATRKAAPLLFFVAVLLTGGTAAVRGQSTLDGFDPNVNGRIRVVFVQPDGKILIGGEFTTLSPNGGPAVTRNRIARLNPDGTLDTAFNPNANSTITSIGLQTDGKIVVGGGFTAISGQTRNRIARLDATTGQPDSFDPNANDAIYSVAVQTDGKILAGGVFTSIGGQPRNRIARLDPTTGLPDSFNPNANGTVVTITLQADGKILVGGVFSQQGGTITIGGQARNGIARLDPTTGLADSFNPDANGTVTSIAVQADGKILAGGFFSSLGIGSVGIGGEVRNHIARLDPTTGQADSFDPNANEHVNSIAIQPDGKIVIGGFFTSIGGQTRNRIARLDPASGLPDSFNPNGNDHVFSVALQRDGKILAGGDFTTLAPNGAAAVARNRIARLETDGLVDQTLNVTTGNYVFATAVQADGKILIGGEFFTVSGVARPYMARLNTDGTLDPAFDAHADGEVNSIAVQGDGKILVGGRFFNIGGQVRNRIARLDAATGLADSFNPDARMNIINNPYVNSITVQGDGKILVSGLFDTIGGQPRNCMARLDGTTGLADSFNPNANTNSDVVSIAVQADSKVLLGGRFFNIGAQPRNNIARLDATTALADSFDPNANNTVFVIALQGNGKILVAGSFNSPVFAPTIGGQSRRFMARLDPTTGLADSFNPSPNGGVASIAVQADGKILVGGGFSPVFGEHSIGGQLRNRIARLDPDTGLADSFDPNANDGVFSIAVQADGKVLAGGVFTTVGGQPRSAFARLTNNTAALQNLAVAQTIITWTRGGSSPQLTRVTFEYSSDNVNYALLGHGTQSGSNWSLGGLNLPTGQNFYIRARGSYRSGYLNGSESITESVRNAFLLPAAQAINLSSRVRVEAGDNVGIGGFIITGNAPKQVLLRAIGPSLASVGVPNVLADPGLELHGPAGFTTISNDNWRDTQEAAIQATGLAPTNDFEAAILMMLNPGLYTAIVKGKNNTSGVALVELYDLDQAPVSKLGNISTRAFVSTGANIVIAGFILGGSNQGDDNVILRGIGPSLSGFGVPNALANPTLELRNSNGALLASNNDWQDSFPPVPPQLAPGSPLESVIVATLSPGPYTTLLYGVNNGTGVGLVEVYDGGAP